MMACLPTSLKAICWGVCFSVVDIGMAERIFSGWETIHWSTCIPPIDPPATERRRSIPRWLRRWHWASTMSFIETRGKSDPYGLPVLGLGDEGPVEPLHPPTTLELMTKYLSVSNALPGPIMLSHQPGTLSPSWRPAAWASPDSAWDSMI